MCGSAAWRVRTETIVGWDESLAVSTGWPVEAWLWLHVHSAIQQNRPNIPSTNTKDSYGTSWKFMYLPCSYLWLLAQPFHHKTIILTFLNISLNILGLLQSLDWFMGKKNPNKPETLVLKTWNNLWPNLSHLGLVYLPQQWNPVSEYQDFLWATSVSDMASFSCPCHIEEACKEGRKNAICCVLCWAMVFS